MYERLKRGLDILFAIIMIFLLSPLYITIGLLVKATSKGPIIFKQKRLGKGGIPFDIYKFRTMVEGAENSGSKLDTYKGDSRVTPLGSILRSTSLDEITQLFNILKGDMSFIGPRPPVTYHPYKYENYPKSAKQRFTVRPGVTGLAQINGRNELSWGEKFYYDEKYINQKSLSFDLKILLLTIVKVIRMEGNYDKKRKKGNL